MNDQIPLVDLKANYAPLKDEIQRAWDDVLSGMRLFLGPNVQAFEREFATYCGVEHAIGVSDGTNAVQLALRACGIGPGDEAEVGTPHIRAPRPRPSVALRIPSWIPARAGISEEAPFL